MPGEEEAQQMIQEYQRLGQQAEILEQQKEIVEERLEEMDETIDTLTDIEEVGKGEELMVPLGSGAYVAGEVKDDEHVYINLGSGIVGRKEIGEAIDVLKKRREDMQDVMEEISEKLTRTQQKVSAMGPQIQQMMGGR